MEWTTGLTIFVLYAQFTYMQSCILLEKWYLPGCMDAFGMIIYCYKLFHNEILKQEADFVCVNVIKDRTQLGTALLLKQAFEIAS